MPDSKDAFYYQEKTCFQCHKAFIAHDPDGWAYQMAGHMFCSWHCLRDYESRHSDDPMSKSERRDMIVRMIYDGSTTPEIVKATGCDPRSVLYWRKKLERDQGEKKDKVASEKKPKPEKVEIVRCKDCDREKVIKGLTKWIDDPLAQNAEIEPQLVHDALALIDTQHKLILELQNLISIGTKMMNGGEVE